jgi:hypothetical protein
MSKRTTGGEIAGRRRMSCMRKTEMQDVMHSGCIIHLLQPLKITGNLIMLQK